MEDTDPVDPTVNSNRLLMEAGDLGGRRLLGEGAAAVGASMLLLLLENSCCDLIETVVAVETSDGDLAMMIGEEKVLVLPWPGVPKEDATAVVIVFEGG